MIAPEIRKQSLPLAEIDGHIFTVHVRGFSAFETTRGRKDALKVDPKRTVMVNFNEGEPKGVRFIGLWYSPASLSGRGYLTNPSVGGPIVTVDRSDGTQALAYLLGPPKGSPFEDHLLLLLPVLEPGLGRTPEPYLIFFGGFDSNMDRATEETHLLGVSYPIEDYNSLRRKLGSVDIDADRLDVHDGVDAR